MKEVFSCPSCLLALSSLQVWRYITYVLLHAGYVHFIINLIIQLAVGLPLEVHIWSSIDAENSNHCH